VGLSNAMRAIEPMKSVSLLGSVAPVMYTTWLRLGTHARVLRTAPQTRGSGDRGGGRTG
jgi:hypothetical protein